MSAPQPAAGAGEQQLREDDAAARLAAQTELDRPFVLEAGAGTGKTATLVARLLAWALGPGWERAAARLAEALSRRAPFTRESGAREPAAEDVAAEVLAGITAITFTDAAAAEMAERLAKALAQLVAGEAVIGFAPERLEVPAAALAARAAALIARLDRLVVSTIHAFCRRLLALYPLEAGIHPAFTVDAEGEILAEVLTEVMEERLRAAAAEAPAEAASLALAARGFGPGELVEAAAELLAAGAPPAALDRDPFTPEQARSARAGLAVRAAGLRQTLDGLLGRAPGRLAGALAVRELAEELGEDLQPPPRDWSWLAHLRAQLGEGRAQTALNKLEKWQKGELTAAELEALAEVAPLLPTAARSFLDHLDGLLRLDPELFTAARRALRPILAAVAQRLRARGALTYEQLLALARDLLAGNPAVAAAERRKIDQLLVDEFQDTDRLQCEIVRFLALDGPAAERPGLFLVGDPKQSIYGWRRADLAAYDAFVAEVVAAGGGLARLSVNYRSVPAILAEVERLVAPLMEREEGLQPAFQPLVPSPARAGEAGFAAGGRAPVEHWFAGEEGTRSRTATELEAGAIARDLRRLHDEHGVEWKEAALLLRATSDLDVYLRAFQEARIPYAVARDKSYFRRREVLDAASLVRAVLDPADHLALLACLRAPWVGVPDAALPGLWRRGLPRLAGELAGPDATREAQAARLARETAAEIAPLAAAIPGLAALAGWERSLAAFAATLGQLRAAFRDEPADVFVERLRDRTRIEATEAARFLGPWRLANLERFFRSLIAALDEGGEPADVLRFLRRAVAESREAPEGRPGEADADRVQVMTIHKAKGLDFRHVYLAELHKRPQGDRPSHTAAEPGPPSPGSSEPGWWLSLLGAPDPDWPFIEGRQRQVRAAEQVRLLYVAVTRAKDRLVLTGKPERPPRSSPGLASVTSFRHLLARRVPALPDPASERAALVAAGLSQRLDAAGWLWRCPDLEAPAGPAPPAEAGAILPDGVEVARQAAALAARQREALARSARPLRAPVSAEAHRALAAALAAVPDEAGSPPGGAAEERQLLAGGERQAAQWAGTAIHRFLERFDFAAAEAVAAGRAEAGRFLATGLDGEALALARHRLDELFATLLAGPLWSRFLALGEHLVARELAVLLPAGEGALGFLAGAIDLLYRDPASGELVLADYKTDEVTAADLAARAAIYRSQLALYQRAVQEALGLARPPRGELWFLGAGEVWVEM